MCLFLLSRLIGWSDSNDDIGRERCLSRSAHVRPLESVIVVQPMIAFKHILVATDFSEASDAALAYGRALTRSLGATLHVLHVVGNLTGLVYGADGYAATLPDIQRELETTARKQLDDLLAAPENNDEDPIPAER